MHILDQDVKWYWQTTSGMSAAHPGGRSKSGEVTTPPWTKQEAQQAADEVARLIQGDTDDPRLNWSSDRNAVQVRASQIVPMAGSVSGAVNRSNRWVNALNEVMASSGWTRHGGGWWRKALTHD